MWSRPTLHVRQTHESHTLCGHNIFFFFILLSLFRKGTFIYWSINADGNVQPKSKIWLTGFYCFSMRLQWLCNLFHYSARGSIARQRISINLLAKRYASGLLCSMQFVCLINYQIHILAHMYIILQYFKFVTFAVL